VAVGVGVHVAGTVRDHRPGPLEKTGNPLDVAIVGEGFFQVLGGQQVLYTRAGAFSLDADGMLALGGAECGRPLEPALAVPQDATEVSISRDGHVSVRRPSDPNRVQVGTIQLARFVNPAGLEPRGDNLFAETAGSGVPVLDAPGTGGAGELRQGYLEGSNVDLVAEMLQLKRFEQQMHALWRAGSLIPPARAPLEFLVPSDRQGPARIADPHSPAHRR
jgi:flagellar basal-body rod protein FlgG